MAQADGVVANGTGSAVRADINGQLAALFTNHSGSTEPATTFAFQTWADTNTNTLKLRNSSNDGWVQLARLDGQFDAKTFNSNVTLNAQSDLRFADSDSSNWVAFQAPATVASNVTWTLPSADGTADQALTTNGSGVLSWADAGGSSDAITEGNTSAEVVDTGSDGHFKVITEGTEALRVTAAQRVGIGTDAPNSLLEARGTGADTTVRISNRYTSNSGASVLNFETLYSGVDGAYGYAEIGAVRNGTATNYMYFKTSGSERARIDSSGRLLAGTTTAGDLGIYGTKDVYLLRAANSSIDGGLTLETSSGYGNNFNFRRSGGSFGSKTAISSAAEMGAINWFGTEGTYALRGAHISASVDGTPSSNAMYGRLGFFTNNGSGNTTERMRILANGAFTNCTGIYNDTTGTGANMVVNSSGSLQRSTSSIKYKTDVENAEDHYSDALLECRPVWYRSTCQSDNPAHSFWGFIAEEVAEIDPRLVHWKTTEPVVQEDGSIENVPCDPEPEGVAYDRFVPHLLSLIKRQKEQLESQAASIASLEARLTALENA